MSQNLTFNLVQLHTVVDELKFGEVITLCDRINPFWSLSDFRTYVADHNLNAEDVQRNLHDHVADFVKETVRTELGISLRVNVHHDKALVKQVDEFIDGLHFHKGHGIHLPLNMGPLKTETLWDDFLKFALVP